jgi:hypothetical protein
MPSYVSLIEHRVNTVLCCHDIIQKPTFKNANLISGKKMYAFIRVIEAIFAISHILVAVKC